MKTVADLIMNSGHFQIGTPVGQAIHSPTENGTFVVQMFSITHRHWTTQGAGTSSSYLKLIPGGRLVESTLPCDDLLSTSSRSVLNTSVHGGAANFWQANCQYQRGLSRHGNC